MNRIILRQGNIIWSKEFVDTLRSREVILSKKDKFFKNAILINHGNSNPITLGKKVSKFYIINKPEAIKFCVNKMRNYKILDIFYPDTYESIYDVDKFPVFIKPIGGHHGYGAEKVETRDKLKRILNNSNTKYIIQDYVPIKHEFRFNVFDRDIFNVSHKIKQDYKTEKGGLVFGFRSLGQGAKISDKFKRFVKSVIDTFHRTVGYDLGTYCVDVMKGEDGKYYLSELNSAYGIGQFTLEKMLDTIDHKYKCNELERYRVKG